MQVFKHEPLVMDLSGQTMPYKTQAIHKKEILFKLLDPAAKLPTRGTPESAGLDLHTIDSATIAPGQTIKLRTGLAVQLPEGMVGMIFARSSKFSQGLDSCGVVDADYRGPVLVVVRNCSDKAVYINAGERVAQMLIMPVYMGLPVEAEELSNTDRGDQGFGSTGK